MDSPPNLESTTKPNHSQWGLLLLLLIALGAASVMNRSANGLEGWSQDFEQASKQSEESRRPMLVAFSMDQCGPCVAMERTVFPDSKVRTALEDFVPVYVKVEQNLEVARKFDVYSTPTFAVVTDQGKLAARTSGYLPAEDFVDFLAFALDRAGNTNLSDPPTSPDAP